MRNAHRIDQLEIVLAQILREVILIACNETADDEIGQPAGCRIAVDIDSRNAHLRGDRLAIEKRNGIDHVARVAQLEFVDYIIGN